MALLQPGEAAGGAVRQHLPAVREINLNTETLARTQSITLTGTQVSGTADVSSLAFNQASTRPAGDFLFFFIRIRTLVWF